MSSIIVENLVKQYPKKGSAPPVTALDGLNFRVERGEIYGLLGLNGAGKSTAVKILTTLIKSTSGSARVLDCDPEQDGERLRPRIGLVSQSVSLNDHATVRENFLLFGNRFPHARSFVQDELKLLAQAFDVEEMLTRLVTDLSGGMKRKVDVAVSLLHRPELLFLDEPTLGLDVPFRRALWQHLAKVVRERQMTILLTTHYLEEADRMCDRVGIIHRGKLVAEGKPAELRASIRNPDGRDTTLDDVFLHHTGVSIAEEVEG